MDKLGDIEPKDQIIDLRDYLGFLGKKELESLFIPLFALASVVYSRP